MSTGSLQREADDQETVDAKRLARNSCSYRLRGCCRLRELVEASFRSNRETAEDRPFEMTIGDSMVMGSTLTRERTRAFFYLYVPDADATYKRALAAGAKSIEGPRDTPYGDRRAMISDRCGNDWQLATRQR